MSSLKQLAPTGRGLADDFCGLYLDDHPGSDLACFALCFKDDSIYAPLVLHRCSYSHPFGFGITAYKCTWSQLVSMLLTIPGFAEVTSKVRSSDIHLRIPQIVKALKEIDYIPLEFSFQHEESQEKAEKVRP